MVTFEQISVALEHPLVLLLIGAAITSLLIPWFAKRSENRKKELEIKVGIASIMGEIIGSAFSIASFRIFREKAISTPAEKDAAEEDSNKLFAGAYKTRIMLASYSSDENIKQAWKDYAVLLDAITLALSLYLYKNPNAIDKSTLEESLRKINEYFSDNNLIDFSDNNKKKWKRLTTDMTLDRDLWSEVNSKVAKQGEKIIKDFLKSRIRIF